MKGILITFKRKIKKLIFTRIILNYISSIILLEKVIFKKTTTLKYLQLLLWLRCSQASQLSDIPTTYQ